MRDVIYHFVSGLLLNTLSCFACLGKEETGNSVWLLPLDTNSTFIRSLSPQENQLIAHSSMSHQLWLMS